MGKLFKILLSIVVVYFAVGIGYQISVGWKLKGIISPARSSDVEIKDVHLGDWYLEADVRTGTAVLVTKTLRQTPEHPRGLEASETPFTFQCTGRFWPAQVQPSHLPRR